MSLAAVIIPFRDRGQDPLRAQNLDCILEHWYNEHGWPHYTVSDGGKAKEPFNRSRAYNRGIKLALKECADYDVFIFAESDMLVNPEQIDAAMSLAVEHIGMVVPFDTYWYHSPESSVKIRGGSHPSQFKPKWKMENCTSIGAINVVSRKTMETVGRWDEKFCGNWYDDDAMKLAFDTICGETRFVEGIGHHLYHLPGHRGHHLYAADREATRRNQQRLALYECAAKEKNVATMRRLLKGEI